MAKTDSSPQPEHGHQHKSYEPRGTLMAIGGSEDKCRDRVVLSRFVEMAGGKSANIAVIPTASTMEDAGEEYERVFRELGAKQVAVHNIQSRRFANSNESLALLEGVTGIFISGGDQVRLVEVLSGTHFAQCIHELYMGGCVVAGTSAGASVLASHMMDGGGNEETPRKGMVNMIAGFGLAPDLIIDQHFSQRGRIGRLLVLFASSPGTIALGIDEDTAAIISPHGQLEVLGANSVTIIEGRSILSDYFEVQTGDVVTISPARLHVLGSGRTFDMESRAVTNLDTPGS